MTYNTPSETRCLMFINERSGEGYPLPDRPTTFHREPDPLVPVPCIRERVVEDAKRRGEEPSVLWLYCPCPKCNPIRW